ncbi:hypothetical protein [Chromobacterium vaccinii]|uniref:hypothetical protein n=1 Tax=Chromobacterium vaccinii TaxID=1108595 RepID=UPI001319BD56|nr:hypothetical protein [Chromobacterium vaccinii]
MNNPYLIIFSLFLAQTNIAAFAEENISSFDRQIKKIDPSLYRDIRVTKTEKEAVFGLILKREQDGYSEDSIRICLTDQTCREDDWELINARNKDYFNTPNYSEANIISYRGSFFPSAFNLCQVSNSIGEVSMSGQCLTIVGEKGNKKFIYSSYLGKASKCRPDSKCWRKSAEKRLLFISKFLEASQEDIPNRQNKNPAISN